MRRSRILALILVFSLMWGCSSEDAEPTTTMAMMDTATTTTTTMPPTTTTTTTTTTLPATTTTTISAMEEAAWALRTLPVSDWNVADIYLVPVAEREVIYAERVRSNGIPARFEADFDDDRIVNLGQSMCETLAEFDGDMGRMLDAWVSGIPQQPEDSTSDADYLEFFVSLAEPVLLLCPEWMDSESEEE